MKNFLNKAVVAAGVMASALALSSVCAFAYDYDVNCVKDNGFTFTRNKGVDANAHCTINANAQDGKGVKFNRDSGKVTEKKNIAINHIEFTCESGDTVTITCGQLGGSWRVYKATSETAVELVDTLVFAKVDDTDSFKAQDAGTYYLTCSDDSGSNGYVKAISSKSGVADVTYAVSGSITAGDFSGSLKIGNNDVTLGETYTVQLIDGTYPVTVDDPLYSVSPASITVSGAAVTQNITITKKAVVTVSGTIDSKLGVTGSVVFADSDENQYAASVSDGNYQVSLPQNGTYTVDLLNDEGYAASQYVPTVTTVSTKAENVSFNIGAEKITTWDFANAGSTLPSKKIEGKTGTYKGIAVDASNGKFDAQESGKRVQFNQNTVITVPGVNTQTQKVVAYDNNGKELAPDKATVDGDTITAVENTYLYKIAIEPKGTIAESMTAIGTTGDYFFTDCNENSYVVFTVNTDAEMAKDKLVVKVGNNEVISTSKVYGSVVFSDTSSVSAEDDLNAKALYAVKITDKGITGIESASYTKSFE